ncbi:MAG: hypothetical protein LBG59_02250 [Candidatus Peribacteria bacterium]|jgi:hypothetical protein|nr:hypothetical protein [Candidatus Peribacteria bacterium]
MRVEEKSILKDIIGRSPDIYDMVMMRQVYDVRKIVSTTENIVPVAQDWTGLL